MYPIIQIAGIHDYAESLLLIKEKVRFLGFPLRLPVHAQDLSENAAAEIIQKLPPEYRGVVITYEKDKDEILKLCSACHTNFVQLHSDISVDQVASLHREKEDLFIIKSLIIKNADNEKIIQDMRLYEPYVSAFITDSFDPKTGACGATGKCHDWAISADVVRRCSKPVILAGGLTPDNVYDAICTVQPAGVDCHTGVEDAKGRKSKILVRRFVREATRAFDMLKR